MHIPDEYLSLRNEPVQAPSPGSPTDLHWEMDGERQSNQMYKQTAVQVVFSDVELQGRKVNQ